MSFSYGSHTVTLASLCVPFFSQKNTLSNFKMNLAKYNVKDKNKPAGKLDGGSFKILKKIVH